jgi:hypothetical protein
MKRVDVSAVCIIPEMIFYKHLHPDLSFWHDRIIDQKPETTASIISGLLFFVGKWFAGSKQLFWEDVIR